MKTAILTVGDELLIGQVVDTNSAYMARLLNSRGFEIVHKATVGDDAAAIRAAIDTARSHAAVVLMTGGLGPTKDDITLCTLCDYFGCKLHFSDEVYANIERIFARRGIAMNPLTRNQALVPDACTVIQNEVGTAPCTWFEQGDGVLVSMPGVPSEMEWLMVNEVVPRLSARYQSDVRIAHRTCLVARISESLLAQQLDSFENSLPPFIKLAYLPDSGVIRLRLSAYAPLDTDAEATVESFMAQLRLLVADHWVADDDKPLEAVAGAALKTRGLTVGTAESCTGGAIASAITSVAGSSEWFKGAVVAYANEVKQAVLGVSASDLQHHGAVSRQVVERMAIGAQQTVGCDYAIATSGYVGPTGGDAENRVGTVWIAVAGEGVVTSERLQLGAVRSMNIRRAVYAALLMLIDRLKK